MNIQKMMRQAQQMQQKMAEVQEGLADRIVEATAGGGKVTVQANAAGEVLSIRISPDVVSAEDVEMLEDLILAGVRDALERGRQVQQNEMSRISQGMGLPPGLGL